MRQSILVAVIHVALVSAVWISYGYEQRTLPRAWAFTAPVDPYNLMRGRYVRLSLLARVERPVEQQRGRLFSKDGQLYITSAECCTSIFMTPGLEPGYVRLYEQASYYIPENIPDPSVLKPGEQLWVEVAIPEKGAPRPVQLAVKSLDGSWRPVQVRSS